MKFFTFYELTVSATACQNGIDNTPGDKERANLMRLVNNVLDPAREALHHPIKVNSGYRCYELNKLVKGATNSYHLQGRAADLDAGKREYNRRLYEILKKLPHTELINEHDYTWIHVAL